MQKLLGNLSEGLLFVVSAPAGTGKTTLVRLLTEEFPTVVESVSCTTRAPRPGETEGKDYFFLTQDKFHQKIAGNLFLEYAEVFGHFYGTSKEFVRQEQKLGKHVVLVIDTQGALRLKEIGVKAVYIFIAPPSLEVLEKRLVDRRTESEQERAKRLSWAAKEIQIGHSYDFFIENTDLNVAYAILRSIVIAEEHKVCNLSKEFKV